MDASYNQPSVRDFCPIWWDSFKALHVLFFLGFCHILDMRRVTPLTMQRIGPGQFYLKYQEKQMRKDVEHSHQFLCCRALKEWMVAVLIGKHTLPRIKCGSCMLERAPVGLASAVFSVGTHDDPCWIFLGDTGTPVSTSVQETQILVWKGCFN